MGHFPAVIVLNMIGDMLIKRSAHRDVNELHAPAYPQNRYLARSGFLKKQKIESISRTANLFCMFALHRTVKRRVKVFAARQNHTVCDIASSIWATYSSRPAASSGACP